MSRIRTGWRLAKESWAVLKADRSLVIFPVLAFAFGAIAVIILIAPGVAIVASTKNKDWAIAPFAVVAGYAATFLGIYFNVALAGAASLSLDGKDTTLADGLAVARQRRGVIAKWAAVQLAFGLLLNLVEQAVSDTPAGRIVAAIIRSLVGAAWAIATFFVVPVLAFEGVGPGDAFKRSVALIKARWGEGLVGNASIGFAVFLVALLPVAGLVALAGVTADKTPVVGGIAIGLAVLVVIAAAVIGSALGVIFRVALYRYATAGQATAGFSDADLSSAFRQGKR
jgi:hypothetical protein